MSLERLSFYKILMRRSFIMRIIKLYHKLQIYTTPYHTIPRHTKPYQTSAMKCDGTNPYSSTRIENALVVDISHSGRMFFSETLMRLSSLAGGRSISSTLPLSVMAVLMAFVTSLCERYSTQTPTNRFVYRMPLYSIFRINIDHKDMERKHLQAGSNNRSRA